MKIVWQMGKAFSKEVRDNLPAPKPHINTVATMMRRLAEKGFLKYEDIGGTYKYSPAITQREYSNKVVKPLLKSLFDNSIKNAVAFFAREEEITARELKEIIQMIEKKKQTI